MIDSSDFIDSLQAMSLPKISGVRASILERVIFETLSTKPEDAHVRLLQYLRVKGFTEEELELFRNAWSKIIAGNQAFGRSAQPIDPTLFTKELMIELTKNQDSYIIFEKQLEAFETITNNLLHLDHEKPRSQMDLNSIFSALEKYKSMSDEQQSLINRLYQMPPSFLLRTRQDFQRELDYLQEYQQSIAKAVIKWEKVNIPPADRDAAFEPVDFDRLFDHQYRYGHLSITIKESKPDINDPSTLGIAAAVTSLRPKQTVIIPKYFTTDRIIGLELSSDFTSNQEDAFFTYAQFMELTSCRYFNPFPKPVNYDYVDNDGASSATIFIYEYPELQALKDFILPNSTTSPIIAREFPNLLRKFPSVIIMWASQLAVASKALYYLPAVYSSPAFALFHDAFITSDGSLLLSGMIFDDLLTMNPNPLSHEDFLHQLDYYQDSNPKNNQYHQNLQRFTQQVVYPILSNALATSRIVDYFFLSHVYSFKQIGSAMNNPLVMFYNTFNSENKVNTHPTYYVMTESAISFQIQAGNVRVPKVTPFADIFGRKKITSDEEEVGESEADYESPPIDFEQEYDVLHVLYTIEDCERRNYKPIIQCQILPPSPDSLTKDPTVLLTVKSECSCIINLEIVAYILDRKDLSKSERRWGCMRIEYIAPIVSAATEVQELIVYLEEYYNHNILTTVYQSNLFLAAHDRSLDDEVSKNMIIDCVQDWAMILKETKRLSSYQSY